MSMKSHKCQKKTLSHRCLKAATYVPNAILMMTDRDKADTKGWKKLEGRREDERKKKSSKCCVFYILPYFVIRDWFLRKMKKVEGGFGWDQFFLLWGGWN